ncbi:pyridoxamine 5'-phosphate oxidase family protein [Kineococcus aurantiacus]|uniref:Pyridoxamine 5'-phosphate oxidase family protein n=1 Tax=Kineococcus aurantiacus TaxID=37633 RepID=A0A7Y9AUC7_9ACTN|nr:hypothetical protein [Kineococcus aurantiacus]
MDDLADLDPDACRALLGAGGRGRVVFTEHALPAVVPRPYVLWGDRLWFPVPAWTALAGHRDGGVLAFHVDHVDACARAGWSVTVLGPARTEPPRAAPAAARALAADAGGAGLLSLDAVRFTGRVLGRLRRAA